ncbi:MAG: DUF2934 domain-containing protein [Planctomycetaceae bacterium]|nr:DUF2934 domain-containing protein [Planctomycetaceae bacterium]
MAQGVSTQEICAAWASIICSRRLDRWQYVPDDELPIPESWIRVAAYYRFVERGCLHGFDQYDWLDAERSLIQQFRELVDDFLDYEEPLEGNFSVDLRQPMSMESTSDCNRHGEMEGSTICQRDGSDVKMGNVNLTCCSSKNESVKSVAQTVRSYRDPLTSATAEQLDLWKNKVIAILPETGEVIAFAESVEKLRLRVAESEYRGRTWRLMDGPIGQAPLSLKEAEEGGE